MFNWTVLLKFLILWKSAAAAVSKLQAAGWIQWQLFLCPVLHTYRSTVGHRNSCVYMFQVVWQPPAPSQNARLSACCHNWTWKQLAMVTLGICRCSCFYALHRTVRNGRPTEPFNVAVVLHLETTAQQLAIYSVPQEHHLLQEAGP